MIKILYVVSTLENTGPTNYLYNLLKYLDKDMYEACIITLSKEPEDSRWNDFLEIGIKLESLNLSRLRGFLSASKALEDKVVEEKPHIIHSQGIRADTYCTKLKGFIILLSTIHNFPQYDYTMDYGKLLGTTMVFWHRSILRNFYKCIGVSKAVSNNLSENFNLKNTTYIYNGVDREIFSPIEENEKIIKRKTLGLPEKGVIWITAGSLSTRKDPLTLIRLFNETFWNDNSNFLIFLGNGPLYEKCKKTAEQNRNIIFLNKIANVASYLQVADYYISASKAEGFPLAVIEAMASGLPVFLSNIPPHKEIWDEDRQMGLVFPPNDLSKLQESIIEIKNKNKTEMSNAALRVFRSKFSADLMSKKYQELYKDITVKQSGDKDASMDI